MMHMIRKSVRLHEYIYFNYFKYICIEAVNYYSKRIIILHFAIQTIHHKLMELHFPHNKSATGCRAANEHTYEHFNDSIF